MRASYYAMELNVAFGKACDLDVPKRLISEQQSKVTTSLILTFEEGEPIACFQYISDECWTQIISTHDSIITTISTTTRTAAVPQLPIASIVPVTVILAEPLSAGLRRPIEQADYTSTTPGNRRSTPPLESRRRSSPLLHMTACPGEWRGGGRTIFNGEGANTIPE
ncbi:hypothetical protein IF2G_03404 [Cordyceps javanica]|nr:hypothetical protein IF2G_03404 [Cordyceps javanica]